MSGYMIRKPEFLKRAGEAKYFPNSAAVTGIVTLILLNWLIACIVIILFFAAGAAREFYSSSFDEVAFANNAAILLLLTEGLLIVFTVLHVWKIEKRPLTTIGFIKRRLVPKYLLGFGIGFVLLCLKTLPVFLERPATFTGIKPIAFMFLITFIIQSAGEEVLFRGYMMSALLRRGSPLWAIIVSGTVFGVIHLANGYNALELCSVTLLGVVLGAYVLREGSIWGAAGLHAAYNFFIVSLVKVPNGSYDAGYSFLDVALPQEKKDITALILISALLILIALILFAGKNRLVVRKTEGHILMEKALKLAKRTISKEELSYALRISELAESNEGKIAALLYYVLSYGVSAEYIGQVFGEDMLFAAEALKQKQGETPEDHWRRIVKYPAAVSAQNAEIKLEQIKLPKTAADTDGRVRCPMMSWSITEDRCLHLAHIVDGETPAEGEEYISALNHELCRECVQRWTRSHRVGIRKSPEDLGYSLRPGE